jgi:hypothetical protein
VYGLVPLFHLNKEANIPSLYSSLLLLISAVLLAVIGSQTQRDKGRYIAHWFGLAAIFALLFVDEAVSLHELLSRPIRDGLGTSGFLYYPWVIPYGIFAAAVGLVYKRFLLHLPPQTRRGLVIAGVVYVTGAAGGDLIGGYYAGLHRPGEGAAWVWVTLEEVLELLGIIVLVHTLLAHLRLRYREVQLTLVLS